MASSHNTAVVVSSQTANLTIHSIDISCNSASSSGEESRAAAPSATAASLDSKHDNNSPERTLSGTTATGQRWWKSLSEDQRQQQQQQPEPPPPLDEPLCYLDTSHAVWCNEIGWASLNPRLPCWVVLKEVACAVAARHAPTPSAKEAMVQAAAAGVDKLASTHGANFCWAPMFSVVQDPLPALPSPETAATRTTGTGSPPSPTSSTLPLLPFFPPSEELCVSIRGRRYGGPEQYVQAAKSEGTADEENARKILQPLPSHQALAATRAFAVSPLWSGNSSKQAKMAEACRARALQHPHFKALLISTRGRPLVCARSGDALWGTGKQHTGKNMLGQLLTRLRDVDLQVCSQREAAVAIAAASLSASGASVSVGARAGGTSTGRGAAPARDRATSAAGGERLSLKGHFSAQLFDAAANPTCARAFCQALRNSTGPGEGGPTELPFEHATPDGGVLLRRFGGGSGGGVAENGCYLRVHYTGRLVDSAGSCKNADSESRGGERAGNVSSHLHIHDEWIFDSSYGHATPNRPPASSKQKDSKHSDGAVGEPISLVLGKGSMIEGWECALRCMEKGECAEVIIKPAYAYGVVGMKGAIPPSSTLRFHLWLVDVVWPHEVLLHRQGAELARLQRQAMTARTRKQATAAVARLGEVCEEDEDKDEEDADGEDERAEHNHNHEHSNSGECCDGNS